MQLVLSLLQQMSVSLVIAYLFSKSPLLRPLANYSVRIPHKVLIYIIFSCFCILGTYVGLDIDDAIANTRAVGAVLGDYWGTAGGLSGGADRRSAPLYAGGIYRSRLRHLHHLRGVARRHSALATDALGTNGCPV